MLPSRERSQTSQLWEKEHHLQKVTALMGYVIVPRRVVFLFFSRLVFIYSFGPSASAINSVSLLESFQHSSTSSLETQAIKRILVASNGMAAAKVMMSMRQWAHMEVAVGPESRGKSVRPPNVSPPPHNWVLAKIIIMNPNIHKKKQFCEVRVKACDKKYELWVWRWLG